MNINFKRIAKVIGGLLFLAFVVLLILFYRFSSPKSDVAVREKFNKSGIRIYLENKTFRNFEYRVLTSFDEIDASKPSVVFVHGSIGSALDFERYLKDSVLRASANLIAYDRIGYGIHQTGNVQASISFEKEMLEGLLSTLTPSPIILVGYSYGGPIVMASMESYKQLILLAPAVYSEAEVLPWALNLYKWKMTRWLVPATWKAASIEKISHAKDLQLIESGYPSNPNNVISIHGDKDGIVPLENSLYLEKMLGPEQFKLITLKNKGHGLVWTGFEAIKEVIVAQVKR